MGSVPRVRDGLVNRTRNLIRYVVIFRCENALNYLTSWESDIHLPDDDGHYTPLHLAVISGNLLSILKEGIYFTVKNNLF